MSYSTFSWFRSVLALAALGVLASMLGLFGTTTAAPKEDREPFANATAQRAEMIALLKEISGQLKEQNQLLNSGKLKVIAQAASSDSPQAAANEESESSAEKAPENAPEPEPDTTDRE